MIVEARRRLGKALRLPDRDGWWGASLIAIGGMAIIATVAVATGLARFDPMPFGWTWLLHAALLVIVPSLGEEILFRGLIVPPRDRPMSTLTGIGAVAAFILWHPLQAVTIGPPWRATFLDPAFLDTGHDLGLDVSPERQHLARRDRALAGRRRMEADLRPDRLSLPGDGLTANRATLYRCHIRDGEHGHRR